MVGKTRENSLVRLRAIDECCVKFEQAWGNDESPDIEWFLTEVPNQWQEATLQELLWIEWHELRSRRHEPQIESYLERFPRQQPAIRSAWRIDQERIESPISREPHYDQRYRIVRSHASGGLGQIFEATDDQVGRRVALKVVRSEYAEDAVAHKRLVREAEITGRLQHPGIVSVLSIGRSDSGKPYYTMQFIDGSCLLTAIEKFHGLEPANTNTEPAIRQNSTTVPSPKPANHPKTERRSQTSLPAYNSVQFRQLLSRFVYVCRVVQYAHSQGVIHRDIKPSNIMVGAHGETMLVDWGLAKNMMQECEEPWTPAASSETGKAAFGTTMGTQLGTPGYVSPEQAAGHLEKLGPASDIYSLGATLFHLLTGHAPEPGSTFPEVNRVPRPLRAICNQALSSAPEDRYSSASQLAEDIENWLADQPVSAIDEPWHSRMARWSRHHQVTVASLLVGVLLLAVASAVVAMVANHRANEIEASRKEAAAKQTVAEEERKNSDAIAHFLETTLGAPGEDVDGQSVRVVDTLDRQFQELKLAKEIAPRVRMRLCLSIMQTYSSLNLSNRALEIADYLNGHSDFSLLSPARQQVFEKLWLVNLVDSDQNDQARQVFAQIVSGFNPERPDEAMALMALQTSYAAALTNARRSEMALDIHDLTAAIIDRFDPDEISDTEIAKYRIERARALTQSGVPDVAIIELEQVRKLKSAESEKLDLQLAAVYSSLRRHRESLELLRATLDRRIEQYGKSHPKVIQVTWQLTNSLEQAGRLSEAIALAEEVLESDQVRFGSRNKKTLVTRRRLAELLQKRDAGDDVQRSLKELKDVLQISQTEFGEGDAHTLITMECLGNVLIQSLGDREGLTYLKQAYEISQSRFGKVSFRTIQSAQSYAIALRKLMFPESAIEIYESALDHANEAWHPSCVEVVTLKNNMAAAYFEARRISEAAEIFLEICEQLPKEQKYWSLGEWTTINNYLFSLGQLNRVTDQLEFIEKLSIAPENRFGWSHLTTRNFYKIVAEAKKDTGDFEGAEKVYLNMLAKLENETGENSIAYLDIKFNFSNFKVQKGSSKQPDEVGQIFEEIEQILGRTNVNTTVYRTALANDLVVVFEDYEEAEPHYRVLKKLSAQRPNTLKHAGNLTSLGICLFEMQQFEESIQVLQESLQIRESIANKAMKYVMTIHYLAGGHLETGEIEKGLQLLAKSYDEMEQLPDDVLKSGQKFLKRTLDQSSQFLQNHGSESMQISFQNRRLQLLERAQ